MFFPELAGAQTAGFIQTHLQTKVVNYGQAVRFVLEAADVNGSYNKSNEQDPARFAVEKKWLPEKALPQDPITLEKLSRLIIKAFGLKGGIMYSLFNSAHYSYCELVYRDIIQGRSDPQMKVTGGKMFFIISRLLYLADENPWTFVTTESVLPEDTL